MNQNPSHTTVNTPSPLPKPLAIIFYGMSPRTTILEFETLFARYLPLVRCELVPVRLSGPYQTCAIVHANTPWQHLKILRRQYKLHGRFIFSEEFSPELLNNLPKELDSQPGKLIIRRVPKIVQTREFTSFFSQFGSLKYAYLVKSKGSHAYNFGFVRFEDIKLSELLASWKIIEFNGSKLTVNIFKNMEKMPNLEKMVGEGTKDRGSGYQEGSLPAAPKNKSGVVRSGQTRRAPGVQNLGKKVSEIERNHHIFRPREIELDHAQPNLQVNRGNARYSNVKLGLVNNVRDRFALMRQEKIFWKD